MGNYHEYSGYIVIIFVVYTRIFIFVEITVDMSAHRCYN